jgi:hypothetical protein
VSREPVHSEILKYFVPCNLYECLKWAADYQNFSTIVDDFTKGVWLAAVFWTDENNRHLLCELEDGEFAILDFLFRVTKGSPILKCMNDVIDHVVEAGIFMHVRKWGFSKKNGVEG